MDYFNCTRWFLWFTVL